MGWRPPQPAGADLARAARSHAESKRLPEAQQVAYRGRTAQGQLDYLRRLALVNRSGTSTFKDNGQSWKRCVIDKRNGFAGTAPAHSKHRPSEYNALFHPSRGRPIFGCGLSRRLLFFLPLFCAPTGQLPPPASASHVLLIYHVLGTPAARETPLHPSILVFSFAPRAGPKIHPPLPFLFPPVCAGCGMACSFFCFLVVLFLRPPGLNPLSR